MKAPRSDDGNNGRWRRVAAVLDTWRASVGLPYRPTGEIAKKANEVRRRREARRAKAVWS